jgi:Flp pilus assembly pilin Flp
VSAAPSGTCQLLVALIAVACIAAITLLGNNASTKFSEVGGSAGCSET